MKKLLAGFCVTFLLGLTINHSTFAAPPVHPVNHASADEDFSAIVQAVTNLLVTRDVAVFTKAVAPSKADYQSIYSTNNSAHDPDGLKKMSGSVSGDGDRVKKSAQKILSTADLLHVDFAKTKFQISFQPPQYLGSTHFPELQAEGDEIRYISGADIILDVPSGETNAGKFILTVQSLIKFPGGWRTFQGLMWKSFPTNIADPKVLRKLALESKAATYKGITEKDDPSLTNLAAQVQQFIQWGDTNLYRQKILADSAEIWALIIAQDPKRDKPSERKEFLEYLNAHLADSTEPAIQMLQQLQDAGIDLKNAAIKLSEVAIDRLEPRGAWGGEFRGNELKIKFKVASDAKAKNGESISGEYIAGANEVENFNGTWRITGNLRWDQLPKGIVDPEIEKSIQLENYVAKHRALPPGTAAPEIEFVRLDTQEKMKLSDLRGKVVILDFWATWCGPCQQPMAELQKIREKNPAWKEQVAIVPISIDDTIKQVIAHVNKRQWTNTMNVWAGAGGGSCAPAKKFRITSVPTTYVINSKGTISAEMYPMEQEVTRAVNNALAKKP